MSNGDSPHFLNGWKEISTYLGRGVRTVQRWETDYGLPVVRPAGQHRAAVIARPADLDAWVQERADNSDKLAQMKERLEHLEAENRDLIQKNENLETALRMLIERSQLDASGLQPAKTVQERPPRTSSHAAWPRDL